MAHPLNIFLFWFSIASFSIREIYKRLCILWPLDVKTQLIGRDLEAGKDRKQKKRTAEDEVVG